MLPSRAFLLAAAAAVCLSATAVAQEITTISASPNPACAEAQITFRGPGSTPPWGDPHLTYEWTVVDPAGSGVSRSGVYRTRTATLRTEFRAAPVGDGFTFSRPPVTVTLRVTDDRGGIPRIAGPLVVPFADATWTLGGLGGDAACAAVTDPPRLSYPSGATLAGAAVDVPTRCDIRVRCVGDLVLAARDGAVLARGRFALEPGSLGVVRLTRSGARLRSLRRATLTGTTVTPGGERRRSVAVVRLRRG